LARPHSHNWHGGDTITLSIDVAGLAPGFYVGTVTVTDNVVTGFQGEDDVTVFLTVQEGTASGTQVLGVVREPRLDILNGQGSTPVSLQDQKVHIYQFHAVSGVSYDISVDTAPSSMQIEFGVTEIGAQGQRNLVAPGLITTPFNATVTASQDGTILVLAFDPFQANVDVSVAAMPTAQPFDTTGFDVVFHLVGDSFFGLIGQQPVANEPRYGGLTTAVEAQAFLADLTAATNSVLQPTGVQLRSIGLVRLSNTEAEQAHPALFDELNGVTRAPAPADQGPRDAVGALGVPASDPQFGKALDVFLFHSPSLDSKATSGLCDCQFMMSPLLGGVFVGAGNNHSLTMRLFAASNGNFEAAPISSLANTLAHEMGHFLGLHHTTNAGTPFSPDGFADTPQALDLNNNGEIDAPDSLPDSNYVMFPFSDPAKSLWSTQQANAIRGYLAIREH